MTADPQEALDPADVTVVVAMRSEGRPVQRLVPGLRLIHAGIGLSSLGGAPATSVVISAGLAGGLDPALQSGTVVVPAEVAAEDGRRLRCDPAWSAALEAASRSLGFPTVTAPLLSAAALVTGPGRGPWFARGFAAVDMESALLAATAERFAAVRVVIDTPTREISPAWVNPRRAALDPRNWREAAWLARATPRLTRRAAEVLAAAVATIKQASSGG